MSGRGGRRTISFSVEAVGINRGESLPPSIQQPTPVYPVMEQKPLPLSGGEEAEYLLALKQEFRGAMRSLPHYIHPAVQRGDVERYSDKYHSSEPADTDWSPDWKLFPKELRAKRPSRGVSAAGTHCTLQTEGQKKKKKKKEEEVLLTLEKKEQQSSEEEEEEEEGEEEEKKKKKKQDEEEAEAEEEYDEEEFEEETDYIMSYFDNGEEFGGDSDENMDEAVY
ncbi:RNA polymerase III subunit GL b isoform X2 [Eleginops maclovinus]|uniref:RNA polymerase III subunit GL b isoform X2 n=1 Tax=Eleginops maclovinus TaxID=56733 RepID=UPI0030810223